MHRHPAVFFVRPLEQREIRYPKEVELAFGNKVKAASKLQTEGAECAEHNVVAAVRYNKDNIAGFCAKAFSYGLLFFLGKEFFIAGGCALFGKAGPCKTLCLKELYRFGKLVYFFSCKGMNGVFCDNRTDGAFFQCTGEHLKFAVFKQVGKVYKLHSEAGIRLIGAVSVHCLVPGHTLKRGFYIHAHNILENTLYKTLVHGHYVIFVNKAHLHINLGELRLAVGAKVLVTEAAGNLHISVAAGHHKKLLIELGALGQRIEASGMNTGGNKIVPCALGG